MAPLYPSFTPTYHHDPYPAIDPSQPHLDCSNKIIIVTGAGRGIGEAIAIAFSKAHAKGIAILGRTASSLESTAAAIKAESPSTDVFTTTADITQALQVQAAMDAIVAHYQGAVPDVLVNNAGGASAVGRLEDQDLDAFWNDFALNVKGPTAVSQAFIRAHRSSTSSSSSSAAAAAAAAPTPPPTIVNISSGAAHLPYSPGAGTYIASKLAGAKLTEVLHYELPEWNIFNVQPGVVLTDLARAAGRKAPDAPALPGHTAVWLAADPRARALNGAFVWANWDVEELLARKDEIAGNDLLRLGLKGWAEGCSVEELIRRASMVHRNAD